MFSRSTLKAMARLALAAMLLAQAALVLAACESVRRSPALALASTEHRIDGETCHEQGRNTNLCLAHCLGEDQSLDIPYLKVLALSGAPVLWVPVPRASPHDACAPRHLGVPPAAAPPPRILFQSLLI